MKRAPPVLDRSLAGILLSLRSRAKVRETRIRFLLQSKITFSYCRLQSLEPSLFAKPVELSMRIEDEGCSRKSTCNPGTSRMQPDDKESALRKAESEVRIFRVRADRRIPGAVDIDIVKFLQLRPKRVFEQSLGCRRSPAENGNECYKRWTVELLPLSK